MGEVAEMMMDGTLCEGCGSFIDTNPPGHPRRCGDCGDVDNDDDFMDHVDGAEEARRHAEIRRFKEAEHFVVTALETKLDENGPRGDGKLLCSAKISVRHLIPDDAGSDPLRICSDPIEMYLTRAEAWIARSMVFNAPDIVLALYPADGRKRDTTLESDDGKFVLVIQPRYIHG